DANAIVVVTSQGVVVIDTGNNQPETRNILKNIQAVTKQPVRYVIITQNHGDHFGGTPLFSPPAMVIMHERVAKDWKSWKPHLIKSWRKRFSEREEALKDFHPMDTVVTLDDHMTLNLGGKILELIYVDDKYNPGDIGVWLPQSGVLHAGFVGYKERHPDIRPDYSHGTTWGMLKQLEVLSALKPRVVVPAHGPLGDVTDLHALTDYLLLGREKVRTMMAKGLPLAEIETQFNMNEHKGWDRDSHYPWMAETIHRELQGAPPQVVPITEHTMAGTITKIAEEGRFLTANSDAGQEIRLRTAGDSVFEGVADRSELKVGMKF